MRPHASRFLHFLRQNLDKFEPIIYTSGVPEYSNQLIDILDPNGNIFEHRLFQNACYKLELKEDDLIHIIKNVRRFKNRSLRRSVMVDTHPLTFLMAAENGF